MNLEKIQYRIHFIDPVLNELKAIKDAAGVPRVADEIRLGEYKFYEVTKIVWIYDEPECPFQRVNIGIKPIE